MEITTEVAKNEIQSLVNLVKKEAGYLCCFDNYAQEFEGKKATLNGKLQDVSRTIDKARGISHVTSAALQWKHEAEKLIDVVVDAKKEECFNKLCLNCWRQYRKGRDLAKRTLDIDSLLGRSSFDIVDGPIDLPERKFTFEELEKALKDEENNKIGLYGLGGIGKTSMATEVGAKLEGTTFDKVIFLIVSKPPDFKKLRGEIARQLGMILEDGEQEVHQDKIFNKINALKGKLLIVLDDVWEKFDLTKELGIPPLHLHKGCRVLITTRIKDICTKMGCQRKIHLDALTYEEALSLFLQHTNNSSNLESLAQSIVEHCDGIPVLIEAVAGSLKDQPIQVWKESLRNLQSGKSILKVREDLNTVYEGLKLSYDNLKNEKAKKLFLISSLFPKDFEIPIELLITIGIGMGPFGEFDDYNDRRQKVLDALRELQVSLLLNAERECVKMLDLVHKVALLIGEKDIQSVIESELPVKNGLQCLLWKNNDFPKQLDGGNLEILIMLLDPILGFDLKVPDTFFSEMTKLKVLILRNKDFIPSLAPPLLQSIQSLQDLRTLNLENLELCSISMLEKLPNLETLWLDDCSFVKLSGENFQLEKLRFLRIKNCKIKMSNPFELIKACPKLEELTFLDNVYGKKENKDTISQNVSFHALQIFQISSDDLSRYIEQYGSVLSRCFAPHNLMQLISAATFKQLAIRAELLILRGYEETEQKNLITDIVSVDDRGMTDLIILKLDSCPSMQCLIDGMNNHFYVNAFSNLVELSLYQMGLTNILFNGNYNLCCLKTMTLKDCPKLTSIFLPSTAQSLSLLEELTIKGCGALECILDNKSSRGKIIGDDGDNDQKSYGAMFPKFKILVIESCDNLEIILPILPGGGHLERIIIRMCEKLNYIFDKFQEVNVMASLEIMELFELPSLVGIFRKYKHLQQPTSAASRDNMKEKLPSTKAHSFCWAQVCCFKSRATSEKANGAVATQELAASTYEVPHFNATQSLLGQSLMNVKEIHILECGNIISLSSLYIAASTVSLETLTIMECHKLKCITTHMGDAQVNKNYCHLFPRLKKLQILECEEFEFLFVSATSLGLEKLEYLAINGVPKLKYFVDNYQEEQHSSNQNQIDEFRFNLPALKTLDITNAPIMNGICSKNYKLELSSLKNVKMWNCGIKPFTDIKMVNLRTTQELDTSRHEVPPFYATQRLFVQSLKNVREIDLLECGNLISLSTLSIAASTISLEALRIRECHKLKCISTHEGDAQVDNCYLFPRLEMLQIMYCDELEFLFVSAKSISLEKLEYLDIEGVPKLKYVVGNYQEEQHSSNQNQIDELHFNLPALETLHIRYAPMMNSICSKNYKPVLSSLEDNYAGNFGVKSSTDYNMVNLKTTQELDVSTDEVPPFYTTQSFLVQSLKNVRQIYLRNCGNIISLSTLSIAASTILLETLTIKECHKLRCITTHEGATPADKNYCSIFPRLKELEFEDCEELKFLFVSSISVGLEKLKSLTILRVPKLNYVVGNYQEEQHLSNQNQIDELHFNLPALETLDIKDAPMMNGICSKNYKAELSSLKNIYAWNFGIKSFTDYNMVNLRTTEEIEMERQTMKVLGVRDSKTEEIVNLRSSLENLYMRQLNELVNICVGPKHIIFFHRLQRLSVTACESLRVIFSTSIVRSLPMLKELEILRCKELVHIVEEDYETNIYEPCFPNLERVSVYGCNKLKYLFCITISDILPKLRYLEIREAEELKHVLIRQDEMKEMVMKDVLPRLSQLTLMQLPNLVSVCHGIDFQILKGSYGVTMRGCPNFSFYETSTTQLQASPETADSQVEKRAEEMLSLHLSTEQSLSMGEVTQQSLTKDELVGKEVKNEEIMMDPSAIGTTNQTKQQRKLLKSL